MSNSVLSSQRALASYEQAELLQQFTLVAQATGGVLDPRALRLGKQRQELISKLRWGRLTGDIYLQRGWTVLITTRLFLPALLSGELRFSNVYGEISGSPLTSAPRLDTNWSEASAAKLFPSAAYYLLTSSQEPFTLLLHADQISLSTYRFYDGHVYLEICKYLADLAERAMAISTLHQPYNSPLRQMKLPWM